MTLLEAALRASDRPRRSRLARKCMAWCVHGYTALGLVAAAGMAVLIVRGDGAAFAWAFVLMLAATLIDATDGVLARAIKIKEVLPGFDGSQLDNLIDFLTYAALPLLLLWRAQVLPAELAWCWLPPLVASAYGFCQTDAKTRDGYFRGFPSLWNVVAFYLYALALPAGAALGIVWLLSLLTFVPSLYLYPSRKGGRLNFWAKVLGAVWAALLVWILARMVMAEGQGEGDRGDGMTRWLTILSLAYPAYYLGASWWISVHYFRARQRSALLRREAH